jgi:hypothetical protein
MSVSRRFGRACLATELCGIFLQADQIQSILLHSCAFGAHKLDNVAERQGSPLFPAFRIWTRPRIPAKSCPQNR